jgi:hypothetical protein
VNTSRKMRWARHVECMGRRKMLTVLVGKLKGKRLLGRSGRGGNDSIKCIVKENE